MARKSISWILDFTSKLPNEEEQIKCLQANDNGAIRKILELMFHPGVIWALPEGEVPYKPSEYPHQEENLYMEIRRLYLYLDPKCGGAELPPLKRESMFIQMMENIDRADARMMAEIKDRKNPFPGLKPETVQKAYPGIF
jgi:hypothetical protein